MDPKIWSQLPWHLIERIAHFADIDSRRALGFLPRRLVLPDLNLPMDSEDYTEFNQGRCRYIRLRNARVYIGPDEISWLFGTDDFNTSRSYSFRRDGLVTFYALLVAHHSHHPDHLFFLDAPGGTGKTFVLNTLLAKWRSQQKVCVAVASSGIAAILLKGVTHVSGSR
jgi:hypothetical protein